MTQSPQELYDLARARLAEHRTDQGRALLRRAADACAGSDVELALRIRVSSAWITFEDEGAAPAHEALRVVHDDAERLGLPQVACAARVQAGILHARAGDPGAAWRELRGLDPAVCPPPDRMRLLMNRGTVASELRRFDDAAADLERAADLAADLGQAPVAFMARHNLGWIRFLRGDLPAALRERPRWTREGGGTRRRSPAHRGGRCARATAERTCGTCSRSWSRAAPGSPSTGSSARPRPTRCAASRAPTA